jgi:hypothetical protein
VFGIKKHFDSWKSALNLDEINCITRSMQNDENVILAEIGGFILNTLMKKQVQL